MFLLWYSGGPDADKDFLEYISFFILNLHPEGFEV